MAETHLTGQLLDGVFQGKVKPAQLLVVLAHHLMTLCPVCAAEFEAWRERKLEPAGYGPFEGLGDGLKGEIARLEREGRIAKRWLEKLLPLPQEERLARVRRARARLKGRAFVEALLAASRERLPGRPRDSFEFAELAEEAAYRSTLEEEAARALLAQARALKGNARRALGDLAEADRLIAAARSLVAGQPLGDPLVEAELDALEGVLRKDQRRFGEAAALLDRAADLYRSVADRVEAARVLTALAMVHDLAGDPEKAAEVALSALRLLDPDSELDLYLGARYNVAHYLHSAGRHHESVEALAEDLDRFERCTDVALQVRFSWLQGKLSFALGQAAEAEMAFTHVRAYFQERDLPLDAAHVGLDLALLYLDQGRLEEIKALAAEAVAAFRSQGVHREALAALILFQQAAEAEQVTAAEIRRLGRYLEQAKRDPSLAYEVAH